MERFSPMYRGGSGPPLLLLHGFTDTWSTWELVLPRLTREREVLAPTLPGHAGGPALGSVTSTVMVDAVERMLDDAGWDAPAVAGNSLGGHVALQLAARGRASSVVALAPAGGWEAGADPSYERLGDLLSGVSAAAPYAEALVTKGSHVPADLVAHHVRAAAQCDWEPLLEFQRGADWPLDTERIRCPVRIVWGTEDDLLPWPAAAARLRRELWHADWIELDGVGHRPQLDVPLETAQLILGA